MNTEGTITYNAPNDKQSILSTKRKLDNESEGTLNRSHFPGRSSQTQKKRCSKRYRDQQTSLLCFSIILGRVPAQSKKRTKGEMNSHQQQTIDTIEEGTRLRQQADDRTGIKYEKKPPPPFVDVATRNKRIILLVKQELLTYIYLLSFYIFFKHRDLLGDIAQDWDGMQHGLKMTTTCL